MELAGQKNKKGWIIGGIFFLICLIPATLTYAEELHLNNRALPAESVSLAIMDNETQFLATETVPLEITAEPNIDEDDMEFLVGFSTNGKKYSALDETGWQDFVPTSGNMMRVNQALPVLKKDSKVYIKVSVRTKGRTTVDLEDMITVNAYLVMPLVGVTLDSVGNNSASQIILEGGIILTASAENKPGYMEIPTYRFSYRAEGSTKWICINKAFSTNSTISFLPKKEGTYYFKVEGMSLGRKAKTGDVIGFDYQAYLLSNTAEPVKGVYDLIPDEKDYENGDTVSLDMRIDQNIEDDPVEYQLLYSTNGKQFKPLNKEYIPLNITARLALHDYGTILVSDLPAVKKDTIYYLKVQVRTVGRTEKTPDAFAMTQVEFKPAFPVEEGEVTVTDVGDNSAEQNIGGGITLVADSRPDTEYRFGYQMLGNTKWAYVNKGWNVENSISFVPRKDGRYRFCVETRSLGRTTVDTTDITADYYGLYSDSLGAVSAQITSSEIAYTNDPEGIDVSVLVSAKGNGASSGVNTYDLQISYSTNGKKYTVIPGYEWREFGPSVTENASTLITLPGVKKDTHYWVKLEVKTSDHALTDVFNICELDVYMIEPLAGMVSFESNASGGTRLLPNKEDTLSLTALASGDAVYKFYYRISGTEKWKPISSKSVVENQAFFRPSTEGAYEFKAEATAMGRKSKTADVSEPLGEAIEIWFGAMPADTLEMIVADDDNDYIIGQDTEMNLLLTAAGNEAGMEYQILYSNNGGKSYKTLRAWQSLTLTDSFAGTVPCTLPSAKGDTGYLIKAQVRSTGRIKSDIESDAAEVWMLTQEREVTTTLTIPGKVYEYSDIIMSNIAISEPAEGTVEYQLQYSKDGKRWYTLSAHDWSTYNDMGYGSINVGLSLVELCGDTDVFIKLNARMKNGTRIEDFSIDSLSMYNIAPVVTASLTASPSGEEYITLTTTAGDGGYGHSKEYQYSYALAGQSKRTWVPFTSWASSAQVTFMPSLSADYLFKVDVRSKGRIKTDITAEATNEDNGYHLKSMEDITKQAVPEPSAAQMPEAEASTSPSAAPSAEPGASPSLIPSETPEASINGLDYTLTIALGSDVCVEDFIAVETAIEDLPNVLATGRVPVVVQLGESNYMAMIGYELDEQGELASLSLAGQSGEIILGGTEDIVKAWYYIPVEPEVSPSASPETSASAEPSVSVEPSSEVAPVPNASEASMVSGTDPPVPTATPAA